MVNLSFTLQHLGQESGGPIKSVGWSKDIHALAAGRGDRAQLYNYIDGELRLIVWCTDWSTNIVTSSAISPNGKMWVHSEKSKRTRVKHTHRTPDDDDADIVYVVELISQVLCFDFSPNSLLLASGTEGGLVRVWDAATGASKLQIEAHTGSVNSVAFGLDGRFLVSGSDDCTVGVWDFPFSFERQKIKGGDQQIRYLDVVAVERHRLIGHTGPVNSIALSPDGKTLASASDDGTVRLWDMESGLETRRVEGHDKAVNAVLFGADGQFLISASDDHAIRAWDLTSSAEACGLVRLDSCVNAIAISADGTMLASGSDDGYLRLWKVGVT